MTESDPTIPQKTISKREFLRYSSCLVVATAGFAPIAAQAQTGKSTLPNARPISGNLSQVIREKDHLDNHQLVEWLIDLRGYPFVEQSHFDVTSILKIRSQNKIFYVAGVNVENIELTVGTCAEEGALTTAITAFGEDIEILEGWVMGAPSRAATSDIACYPCGECRQRLAQYSAPHAAFHIIGRDGQEKDVRTRAELLPFAFSFRDLEARSQFAASSAPDITAFGTRLIREPGTALTFAQISEWMDDLRSDVRVSGADRRVVFRLNNGAYLAGVKVENAAYPSSTTAIQNAVALMHARYDRPLISEIWTSVSYRQPEENARKRSLFAPISGAALQVIYQFVEHEEVPVNILNIAGESRGLTLKSLITGMRTFSKFTSG